MAGGNANKNFLNVLRIPALSTLNPKFHPLWPTSVLNSSFQVAVNTEAIPDNHSLHPPPNKHAACRHWPSHDRRAPLRFGHHVVDGPPCPLLLGAAEGLR